MHTLANMLQLCGFNSVMCFMPKFQFPRFLSYYRNETFACIRNVAGTLMTAMAAATADVVKAITNTTTSNRLKYVRKLIHFVVGISHLHILYSKLPKGERRGTPKLLRNKLSIEWQRHVELSCNG